MNSTDPHFIRCILPNAQQQAGVIEDAVVLEQLRCNGVLEGIRISRKGFPNRVMYPEFLKRYYLLGKNISRNSSDPRSATATLLDELKINAEQYRFGVTKVFFRAGQLAYIEELREKKIAEMLITVQAASRAMLARQLYKRMSEKSVAVKIIQRNVRAWAGFKNWEWWKLFAKARPLLKRRNFEKEIEEKAQQISSLAAELEQDKKRKEELEQTVKNLEDNISDLNTKLKRERDNAADLADDKSLLEEEKNDALRRIKKFEEELDEYRKDVSDLEKERNALNTKVSLKLDYMK